MFDEFLRKASELRAEDCPFAIAIVIKYEPPVSGKPGDKAIIQADGKVWGWIGGGALDVYIEPVLAKSRILIFGRSLAAQSLSKLGKAVGYAISVVAPEASRELFPDADFIAKEVALG